MVDQRPEQGEEKGNDKGKTENLLAKAARTDTSYRRQVLRKLGRARTRLIVCFWTLPVYVIAIWVLLNNGRDIETIMWIYMGLYAIFAVDMAIRRCPQCGEQFFVKTILLNLFTRRCVHCHLPLQPPAEPPSSTQD